MQKIVKWFTPLIAVGVAIFLIFFLVSINSSKVFLNDKLLTRNDSPITQKSTEIWLDHFSKSERKGYSFPVNEIYVKVNLKEKIIKTITYKLSAKVLDYYQFFCLKEELKQYKLKYYLKKDKISVDLFIYSPQVDKLKELVKALKNYKISATIKPYKEEY